MADEAHSPSRIISFRNAFISGALLLAPLIVTVWAFSTIIDVVGGTFRPIYRDYLPESFQHIPFFWDLVATLVVILLVTLLGYLSQYVFGKIFLTMGERAIQRIPGVGGLYVSVKHIVTTLGTQNRNLFSKVVLVEFPREGCWAVGFLTNKQQGEPHTFIGGEVLTVFIPTAPNPTSGFLIMLPKEKVRELDMAVGDGMKMIISGGAVIPTWPTPQAAELAK
ncbi:MAG TPA: DUF502 domain-containing protein [Opitutus sp.]|nr:DUF502 domain-containing protein [Opitutus sp.]